jgi:hypothetical protein
MISGQKQGPDASFILHIGSLEKKPATSHCTPKIREEQEKQRAMLAIMDRADWPAVILVFTSEGSTVLEIVYVIDPQAMGEAREQRPFVLHSGLSGTVSIPMTEENIRECVVFSALVVITHLEPSIP